MLSNLLLLHTALTTFFSRGSDFSCHLSVTHIHKTKPSNSYLQGLTWNHVFGCTTHLQICKSLCKCKEGTADLFQHHDLKGTRMKVIRRSTSHNILAYVQVSPSCLMVSLSYAIQSHTLGKS